MVVVQSYLHMPNEQLITISHDMHIALSFTWLLLKLPTFISRLQSCSMYVCPSPETDAFCDTTGFAGRMLPYHQLLPSMVFCSGTSRDDVSVTSADDLI